MKKIFLLFLTFFLGKITSVLATEKEAKKQEIQKKPSSHSIRSDIENDRRTMYIVNMNQDITDQIQLQEDIRRRQREAEEFSTAEKIFFGVCACGMASIITIGIVVAILEDTSS